MVFFEQKLNVHRAEARSIFIIAAVSKIEVF